MCVCCFLLVLSFGFEIQFLKNACMYFNSLSFPSLYICLLCSITVWEIDIRCEHDYHWFHRIRRRINWISVSCNISFPSHSSLLSPFNCLFFSRLHSLSFCSFAQKQQGNKPDETITIKIKANKTKEKISFVDFKSCLNESF